MIKSLKTYVCKPQGQVCCSKVNQYYKKCKMSLLNKNFKTEVKCRLQLNYVSLDYTLDALIALGLRLNSFEDQNQVDLIFLLARFFLWLSRSKQKNPIIKNFSSFLLSSKKRWLNPCLSNTNSNKVICYN